MTHTIRSPSGIHMQHPRYDHPWYDLLRYPRPQILQHGLRPFARTCLQYMLLNVLVSYTREDAFIGIDKPQNPNCEMHIQVPIGPYMFLFFFRLDRFWVG